ncbi:Secreted protein [Phytophthora cinnamomi]|uniref:Secreted protein n=1 Tax=Phytophthora cinnamomi TaxID=4785 RepID=UPI003559E920|nr:Secreted protein [Phytophthora cinnamomi]
MEPTTVEKMLLFDTGDVVLELESVLGLLIAAEMALTAPSDSELPAAAAGIAPPDVVDVTGADEPWTTAPARRTSEPAPLRTIKRATSKPASGEAVVDARTCKKKVSKRATVASTAGTPWKPTGDSGRDSDSDLEDKPPAPPAKRPKKTVTSRLGRAYLRIAQHPYIRSPLKGPCGWQLDIPTVRVAG